MEIEIDYSPTDALIAPALDARPEPGCLARHVELTAYWRRADAVEVVAHLLEHEGGHAWLAPFGERPRRARLPALRAALATDNPYDVYVAPDDRAMIFPVREPWRRQPVIHVAAPASVTLPRGTGQLYGVRWALEVLVDGKALPQEPGLLAMGACLRRFLDARFVSRRGRDCRDSPEELHRLGLP